MSRASDLLAHLRPCPIDVEFLGITYRIPAMDAVQWIALIDSPSPDLYEVFPILAGPHAIEAVEDALWEGTADDEDIGMVALQAIGAAGDRDWWAVLKLIRSAASSWDVVHVNSATGMSLAGWLDEVWSKIMAHVDPKKRAAWESDIARPPKNLDKGKREIDFDAEEAAFLAAMNAVMK